VDVLRRMLFDLGMSPSIISTQIVPIADKYGNSINVLHKPFEKINFSEDVPSSAVLLADSVQSERADQIQSPGYTGRTAGRSHGYVPTLSMEVFNVLHPFFREMRRGTINGDAVFREIRRGTTIF
jgi:hypothetical protein